MGSGPDTPTFPVFVALGVTLNLNLRFLICKGDPITSTFKDYLED